MIFIFRVSPKRIIQGKNNNGYMILAMKRRPAKSPKEKNTVGFRHTSDI